MTVRDIFLKYGPSYLEAFAQHIPPQQRKVLYAIVNCRTPALGTIVCQCEGCGKTYELFRSCGNRHCPTCQGEKAHQWIDKRLDTLLPVPHFMITFTVPSAFREFFRSHQRFAYSAFFQSTSSAMQKLASEHTYFPGDILGFFGVLHTWGRTMNYHPHIHYIVPGGAFDSHDHSWNASQKAFYLPIRVLSKLVKHRIYNTLKKEGLLHLLPHTAWNQDWNVNSQPVGTGERSVRYLASYVFRTAISDKRIVGMETGRVLFRYTDTKTTQERTMRLKPFEFIRRFLQHVLPSGFMKIRYYGFMHPSSSIPLKAAVVLLEEVFGVPSAAKNIRKAPYIPRCADCQAIATYLYFIPPQHSPPSGFT